MSSAVVVVASTVKWMCVFWMWLECITKCLQLRGLALSSSAGWISFLGGTEPETVSDSLTPSNTSSNLIPVLVVLAVDFASRLNTGSESRPDVVETRDIPRITSVSVAATGKRVSGTLATDSLRWSHIAKSKFAKGYWFAIFLEQVEQTVTGGSLVLRTSSCVCSFLTTHLQLAKRVFRRRQTALLASRAHRALELMAAIEDIANHLDRSVLPPYVVTRFALGFWLGTKLLKAQRVYLTRPRPGSQRMCYCWLHEWIYNRLKRLASIVPEAHPGAHTIRVVHTSLDCALLAGQQESHEQLIGNIEQLAHALHLWADAHRHIPSVEGMKGYATGQSRV
jgi:hypothetical protein